jgi:hypothetical protein
MEVVRAEKRVRSSSVASWRSLRQGLRGAARMRKSHSKVRSVSGPPGVSLERARTRMGSEGELRRRSMATTLVLRRMLSESLAAIVFQRVWNPGASIWASGFLVIRPERNSGVFHQSP